MIIDQERTAKHQLVQSKILPRAEKVLMEFQDKMLDGNVQIVMTKHEGKRELFRAFARRSVIEAIQEGWPIEGYRERDGSMSLLIMYYLKTTSGYRPMHVYVNIHGDICDVVTVYDPRTKEEQWRDNYQKRIFYKEEQ